MTRTQSYIAAGRVFAQWIVLGSAVGGVCGAASAAFLALLDLATRYREQHAMIIVALPLAGLVLGAIYARWGAAIRGGNNLVIDTIHERSRQIPLRMAPMVLVGTVLTHLFGGSAGREGTAVQMGASLADQIAHSLRVQSQHIRGQLLAAGIAGGFGSVFGTPIAGALFGLEVVVLGRMEYDALCPALISAIVGDYVTRALGIVHTDYGIIPHCDLSALLAFKWLVFALAIAACASVFIELTHRIKSLLERYVAHLALRMALGGVIIVGIWAGFGAGDYLGLGVPTIVRAFVDIDLPQYAFAVKLLLTAITIGSGFLGGEVTPLFFIGATLGNVLARHLNIPLSLGAGVGMAAMFAAASNTPIALSVMAVELLGAAVLPHVVVVAVVAYVLTGHRGIYPSQRLMRMKSGGDLLERPTALKEL